ncbi:protein croquemort-like [Planococcus citri]|uniref:protein croquemort-like n=1 Tax=Planococcus citri TaxID=170843 RepID=UPI0031F9D26A
MFSATKILLYVFGSIIIILGATITVIWKPLLNHIIDSRLVLAKCSETERIWSNSSVPIYFKVYMFNWTNPEETLAKKQKPNFVEMGPYTFRFTQMKSDIVWNSNYTITFRADRIWSFAPEMSNGRLSDRITNINAVAMVVGDRFKDNMWITKVMISGFLELLEKQVYITKTVEELLFQGYENQVLSIGKTLKELGIDVGHLPDRFGWYFNKNASEINIFNIHTGADDLNNLGRVRSWNYKTQSEIYTDRCDRIRGSLGDLWPKNISNEDSTSIFISDFCGSFELIKSGAHKLHGVDAVRFIGTEKTFDNGKVYRENRCYCKNNKCTLPSGVRDISDCVHAPIYISFPHFYLANESYRRSVDGMNPVAGKHQFFVTVQKDSGMVMEIFARLQINIMVEPYPSLGFFANLPRMMVPTVWFEEYIEMPENLKTKIKLAFNLAPFLLSVCGFSSVIIGIVLVLCGCISSKLQRQK